MTSNDPPPGTGDGDGQREVAAKLYAPTDDGSPPVLIGEVPTLTSGKHEPDRVAAMLFPPQGQVFTDAMAGAIIGRMLTLTVDAAATTGLVVAAGRAADGHMDIELLVTEHAAPPLPRSLQEETADVQE